jgi:hypothetical protein
MPDNVYPLLRRISRTPLRDVLRFRFTGRLDWKWRVANSGLPKPAADLICRVVKRTRLWRLEKAAVADELAAHFADGLEAASNVEQLVKSFGDERVAAKLIRRAKRRGRPWPWQIWGFSLRVMAVVLAVYAVLLIRFCLGQPTVSVDYIAKLNAPIAAVPEGDRAWPLWRQAILASSESAKGEWVVFPGAVIGTIHDDPAWPKTVQWLDDHQSAVELARQAGSKSALGFILGPAGSEDDPMLGWAFHGQTPREPLITVLLPHLSDLRTMARILSSDARLAAERGEAARLETDLTSMLGLGRQLRDSDGFLVTQLAGLSVNRSALRRLHDTLINYPDLLKDEQLIRLAHLLSGPKAAADLIALKGQRYAFADIVQRLYTDDGSGDGHTTLTGLRLAPSLMNNSGYNSEMNAYVAASTVPLVGVPRAELIAEYNRLIDQAETDYRQPIRQIDFHGVDSQINAMIASPRARARFAILLRMMPGLTGSQKSCEIYLGARDGAVVAIALELYRRQRGHYPAALSELTPGLLPEIPADRITGDPVKYKLIDGKPVVYSVGADRIDDGGQPPRVMDPRHRASEGAEWGIDPNSAPRGDWVLYAPDSTDPEGN